MYIVVCCSCVRSGITWLKPAAWTESQPGSLVVGQMRVTPFSTLPNVHPRQVQRDRTDGVCSSAIGAVRRVSTLLHGPCKLSPLANVVSFALIGCAHSWSSLASRVFDVTLPLFMSLHMPFDPPVLKP